MPVSPDLVTAILCRWFFKYARDPAAPGSAVLYDVRSSRGVVEYLSALGADPRICKVGHSHAKKLLRETDGINGVFSAKKTIP